MILRLPAPPDRWTAEYQAQVNSLIEQAFAQLNQYAQVPSGGAVGQVLGKASGRDFELQWINNA